MLPRRSTSMLKRLLTITENGAFVHQTGLARQQVRAGSGRADKKGLKGIRPDIVPVKLLRADKPVSGSVEYGDKVKSRKFEWDAESLNARGFLRFQKEYSPPDNAEEIVLIISRNIIPQLSKVGDKEIMKFELTDSKLKFEFLSEAFTEFSHSVPNSMLYLMNTVGDVVNFYSTPITTTTPYEELVRQKDSLPPNLHVQKEPLRFDPETDTMFGGMTAFPKSSTVVTGLRSKLKYKGFEAKKSWP